MKMPGLKPKALHVTWESTPNTNEPVNFHLLIMLDSMLLCLKFLFLETSSLALNHHLTFSH